MCDRLSPDPADRRFQFRRMPPPNDGVLKGWDQEMLKLFAEMLTNPGEFSAISTLPTLLTVYSGPSWLFVYGAQCKGQGLCIRS